MNARQLNHRMLTCFMAAVAIAAALSAESLWAQQLPCNTTLDYQSNSYREYQIPYDVETLTLMVKGGDGGTASIESCSEAGGRGAVAEAQFRVGPGSDQLAGGGTLRFIIGERGKNGSTSATLGNGSAASGGGGGSAILYQHPSSIQWQILLVGGGGGGAYQGLLFFGGCVDNNGGDDGQTGECGSDGNGNDGGDGGCGGQAGDTGPSTEGAGGGAYGGGSGAPDFDGMAGFPSGGNGGTFGSHSSGNGDGGWGFGGGGKYGDDGGIVGGGGGGGGYSGGGGGTRFFGGGGGGSYVNTTFAVPSTINKYVAGAGWSGNGEARVHCSAAGDWCIGSPAVTDGTLSGSMFAHTAFTDYDSCADSNTIDAWFEYTAAASGTLTVTTCRPGTEFDTALAAFAGCPTSGQEIACNDDDPASACDLPVIGSASTISFNITVGTAYYIRLSAYGNNIGSGAYEINFLSVADSDGDGVPDSTDNCPNMANTNQDNADNDNHGDVCDNCPEVANNSQAESDNDGVGDECDACPGFDDANDGDGDGVPDGCDNCPNTSSANQDDTDGDGIGDICDVCPAADDTIDCDNNGIADCVEIQHSAVSFSSVDHRAVSTSSFTGFPANQLTVSFWIRSDSTQDGGILSYAVDGSYNELLIWGPNDLAIYVGGVVSNTGISVADGAWHHVAFTWDSSELKLYVDGTLAYWDVFSLGRTLIGSGTLVLAEDQDSVGGGFDPNQAFIGSLAEVRLWNMGLDAGTIAGNMNASLLGSELGLVGYWRLDEGSGDIARDSTTKGNDLSLLNNALWIADCDENGVLDRCQTDTDGDGAIDSCDVCPTADDTIDCNLNGIADCVETQGSALSFTSVVHRAVSTSSFVDFPTTDATVSFWIRNDSSRGSGILSYAVEGSSNELLVWDPNNLTVYVGGVPWTTGISVADGAWHHVAISWSSASGQAILYVDGAAAVSGQVGGGDSLIGSGTLVLAEDQDAVGGGFDPYQAFIGSLSEVRLWNVVLSAQEVAANMTASLTGAEPGLVGYWRLDEGSGAMAFDATGNGNDLSVHNTAPWTGADCDGNGTPDDCETDTDGDGAIDACDVCPTADDTIDCNSNGIADCVEIQLSALSFTSADHRAVSSSSFTGFPTTEATVSFWIRSDSNQESGILSYAIPDSDNELLIWGPNSLAFYIGGGAWDTGFSVADGTWHHVAFSWSSAGGMATLYLDGAVALVGPVGANHILGGSGTLVLADEQDSVGGGFDPNQAFIGSLAEVRLWDDELNAAQVAANMNAALTGSEPGLVGYWRLDDGSGATAFDATGNGNDLGVFNTAPWTGADCDGNGTLDDCETDSDNDGVIDSCDICPGFDDNVDTDNDGIPDGCDAPCGGNRPLGDLDGDMVANMNDLPLFTGFLLDPTAATADEFCAADMNEDGNVDGLDIQSFMDVILDP